MLGSSFEPADRMMYTASSFEKAQPADSGPSLEMQNIIVKNYLCLEF